MGYSSTNSNVLLCLSALEQSLKHEGYPVIPGAGISAAQGVYSEQQSLSQKEKV
jgi:aspartate aminotransferase-like enzyme